MSRVVGFSLKLEGSNKTIEDIGKVEKALKGITDQINSSKKINVGVLKPLFEGQEQFRTALKATNKALQEQSDLLAGLGNSKNVDKTVLDALIKQVNNLKLEINKLQQELNNLKSPSVSVPNPEGFKKIRQETKKTIEDVKKLAPALEGLLGSESQGFANKIADIDTKLRLVKDNIQQFKGQSGESNTQDIGELLVAEKALITEKAALTKQLNEEARAHTSVAKAIDSTSVIALRAELAKLKKEYLNLSEAEREGAKGQELFNKLVVLNSKISGIEQSLGDYRRNVGNYRDAVSGLLPILDTLRGEGKLTGNSLAESFRNDAIKNIENLKQEVTELATAFDKLTKEQRESTEGVAAFQKLTAKAIELQGALSKVPKETDKIKGGLISLGDLITGGLITGGLLALVGSAKAFGAESIKEFTEAEKALAKIEAQLQATGNASGLTAQKLKGLSTKIEISTGIDGDQVLDQVTSKLLTFVRVQGDVFERAQVNAVDLAQVMGGDLGGAATLLGKALDNPIKGITLLAKAGIGLDEATQNQIKEAIKANDIYKAQGLILTQVEGRVKGVADSIQNSDLKNVREASVAWLNFKEAVGGVIIEIQSGLIELGKRFANGTLFTPVGLRETTGALRELSSEIVKETIAIDNNFDALRDHNTSSEVRKKIIDQIAEKYPDLVHSEELEIASLEDLSRIQAALTANVKKQVFERVKAASQEAILTEIAQEKIRLAFAKRQDASGFGFFEKISLGLGSGNVNKGFEALSKTVEDNIKKLEKEFDNNENVLNEALPEINTSKVEKNYKDAALKVKAILNAVATQLKDPSISAKARKSLEEINTNFSAFVISPNSSQEFINSIIKQGESAYKTIKEVTKKELGLVDDLSAEQKAANDKAIQAAEKRKKLLEDQSNRINELNNRIKDLKIDSIDDEFLKSIKEVKQKTQVEIDKIQAELDRLGLIKIKTSTDNQEIAKLNELLSILRTSEGKQIEVIKSDQAKAIEEARIELEKLKKEIDGIIKDTVEIKIKTNIADAQFDLSQENRNIEIKYNGDIEPLKKALAEGKISQEQYDNDVYELDKARLDKQLKAATNFKNITDDLYRALYKTQLRQLEIDNEKIKSGIILEGQQKQQLAFENRKTGKSQVDPIQEAITIAAETNAKLLEQDAKFDSDKSKLDDEYIKNVQGTEDQINEIQKKGLENTISQTKKGTDKVKEERKQRESAILDLAINSAKEISDAVFEIEKTQQDRILSQQLASLEKSRDARLKMVKGNTAEEERINAEFNDKKNKLERAAFEKGKQLSIQQAIISGSLAVLNALATVQPLIPLGLIAAAGIAVSTSVQIAKIRSTSFAEGGLIKKLNSRGEGGRTGGSNAPPDHTGERPVGTATFHEGEYITPRWQVESNKELIEAMDKDRVLKTNHHSKKYLQRQILQAIEAREKSNTGLFRKREPIPAPVFYQASYFKKEQQNQAIISDETIIKLADTIASKTKEAIMQSIPSAYHESVSRITKDEVRKIKHDLLKAQ